MKEFGNGSRAWNRFECHTCRATYFRFLDESLVCPGCGDLMFKAPLDVIRSIKLARQGEHTRATERRLSAARASRSD